MQSLKTTTNKRFTKKVLIVAVLLVLLAGAGVAIYIFNSNKSDADSAKIKQPDAAPSELSDEDTKSKQDFVDANENKETDQSDSSSSKSSVDMTVTQNGSEVVAQTKLYGVTDGDCTLKVTNSSREVTKKAEILYQPEYSTCAGFSLQTSELGSGTWQLSLSVQSRNSKSDITKTVTVE